MMDDLSIRILRACAGEVVSLPYDAEQAHAASRLTAMGLIRPCFDDDQPTAIITGAGRAAITAYLSALAPPIKDAGT